MNQKAILVMLENGTRVYETIIVGNLFKNTLNKGFWDSSCVSIPG